MKMLLIKEGLWDVMNDDTVCDDPAEYRKFCYKRDRALAYIVLNVDSTLLYLIGDPVDPVEVWEKLQDQFQRKTWANKLSLRRKLYSLKLKEDGSVQDHIKSMVEIVDALSVMGDHVEEEDRVVHILASLPDSFGMLVTALEANSEVPAMEVVIERLLHEEKKMVEKDSHKDATCHDAFVGRHQKACYNCGRPGHIRRYCKAKKEGAQKDSRKNYRSHDSSSSDDVSDDDDDDCEALIVIDQALSTVSSGSKNKWIIDSGASKHMCNDKKLFSKIEDLKKPQMVKVGNGYPVRVKGKGTIKLTIMTNRGIKKCKLRKVLYVPDLSFNLLSVSRSAKAGKSFEFSADDCIVRNIKSGEIVATGKKVSNLYYLNVRDGEEENTATKEDRRSNFEANICLATTVQNVQESTRARGSPQLNFVIQKASSKKKSFGKFKFWKICRSSANI